MAPPPVPPFATLPHHRTPLQARTDTSLKRNRASTTSDTPTLPPHRRSKNKAPKLKETSSFLFTGKNPLYTRHIIEERHDMMLIKCSQLGCTDFQPKVINRSLSGTNNYKRHYEKFHPGIPTSEKEVRAMKLVRKLAHGQNFFQKDKAEQTVNQRFRTLLLEFIIKNNLSFSIVDQLETEQLLTFLSPTTTQISRRTLMKDLKARYEVGEELLHQKLLDHVEQGGRISLTTDGWAGNNKMDYSAITGHYITTSGEHVSTILDIIELSKPIHDGQYLCEKLLEVTERLDITCAIIAVTISHS